MFFILLYKNQLILMIMLGMILPLLFSTVLLDVLSALPKPVKKLLCFTPCIFLVAVTVKLIFTGSMNLFFLVFMFPFFLISIYGGFALMDIWLSKNRL